MSTIDSYPKRDVENAMISYGVKGFMIQETLGKAQERL